MAKLDFNRAPVQQSNYPRQNGNQKGAELLKPGTYNALITKYERIEKDTGMGIKLTFGILEPNVGIVKYVPEWIGVGSTNDTALGYAMQKCEKLMDCLKIPNIFDDKEGITEEDRKHILFKKILVQIDYGTMKANGRELPINKIIGYSPFGTPVQSITQVQPDPGKPQSAGYPPQNTPAYAPQDPRYVTENQGNNGYGQNGQSAAYPPQNTPAYAPQNPPMETHRPQYSATPTNNPEADYAAAFGGDDYIPF